MEPSEGVPIECSAGIQIVDFSPELGETGVEIHLNGIVNPLYTELLQHVEHTESSSDSDECHSRL